jgi:ubiquinone biosynthesis protein
MVTVEGVARRLDPDNDIWAASEPVVARWIARELSPAARVRDFAREARAAVSTLARMAQTTPDAGSAPADNHPAPLPRTPIHAAIWFFAGAAASALAFTAGLALRLAGRL